MGLFCGPNLAKCRVEEWLRLRLLRSRSSDISDLRVNVSHTIQTYMAHFLSKHDFAKPMFKDIWLTEVCVDSFKHFKTATEAKPNFVDAAEVT